MISVFVNFCVDIEVVGMMMLKCRDCLMILKCFGLLDEFVSFGVENFWLRCVL